MCWAAPSSSATSSKDEPKHIGICSIFSYGSVRFFVLLLVNLAVKAHVLLGSAPRGRPLALGDHLEVQSTVSFSVSKMEPDPMMVNQQLVKIGKQLPIVGLKLAQNWFTNCWFQLIFLLEWQDFKDKGRRQVVTLVSEPVQVLKADGGCNNNVSSFVELWLWCCFSFGVPLFFLSMFFFAGVYDVGSINLRFVDSKHSNRFSCEEFSSFCGIVLRSSQGHQVRTEGRIDQRKQCERGH